MKTLGLLILSLSLVVACQKKEESSSSFSDQGDAVGLHAGVEITSGASPELTCAIEVCGSAKSLPTESAPIQKEDVDLYTQEIKPFIEKYIKINGQQSEIETKLYTKFSTVTMDQVSDPTKILVNFFFLMNSMGEIGDSVSYVEKKLVIDEAKLRKALITQVQPEDLDWTVQAVKSYFSGSRRLQPLDYMEYPIEFFTKYNYPGKSVADALAEEAAKLIVIRDLLFKIYPIFKLASSPSFQTFEKALLKEPFTPEEKEAFLSDRESLETFGEILPGGELRDILSLRSFSVQDVFESAISDSLDVHKQKLHATSVLKPEKSILDICQKSLTSYLASSPSQKQNEDFQNSMAELKSKSLQTIHRTKVKTAILNAEFVLPRTKIEARLGLKNDLRDAMTSTENGNKLLASLDIKSQADKEVFLIFSVMISFDKSPRDLEETIYNEVQEFCEENGPKHIADAALSSLSLINVGWRSVMYPEYGYGIAAHELGHVISAADPEATASTKYCLAENKGQVAATTEEDFADNFAMKMLELSKATDNRNYGCLLLRQADRQYSNLTMGIDPDIPDDSHSSGFYRLIALGTHLDNLTPTCQKIKETTSEGQLLKNCWKY